MAERRHTMEHADFCESIQFGGAACHRFRCDFCGATVPACHIDEHKDSPVVDGQRALICCSCSKVDCNEAYAVPDLAGGVA